ncbi:MULTISPECIES: glycosyltransferase family 4 protein [Brevibacterium]|uniref:Glycosyltransferase involved in cell wall bisynthesis n=1 Tax=Brevibacterium antiquum CNRZ 918 TaxID=1255637 RepID=A0A2H1HJY4_9MICO|nr:MULTISPECIES: glycosyltransferase family 4 protein [Brevibacterium]SMX63205.1 Glycosyltransferase involved in cell wall bisynthesis [Brevibacterium antiquum CNRZ 918]HCG57458.1 glycosyl transferase group 1 [Brevibacterium sp.]
MRIVYVLGTSTGGVGTHVRALARDVAAAGHEIGVIGPAQTDEHFGFSSLPGVRFAALDMGTGIGAQDAALIIRLRRAIRSFGPDIVHAHGFRAGFIALLASRTLRPRHRPSFIISLHNRASGRGARAHVETGIETLLARGADLTLGASTDLVVRAHDLGARDARFLPAAAPEVHEIPAEAAVATRAALAEEFGFGPDAVLVLAVGRVAPQKNYPMLVRALGHLGAPESSEPAEPQTPELVFLIAGAADQSVLDEVRSQYEDLAATSAVPALHFLGPRDDIAALNSAADLYVLTSVWEARALVLQEALISGRAIIATNTGGSAELVGDAGILIDDDDDTALAAAIGELAADPARRADLAARAQARGSQLPDERDVAKELVSIYTELMPSQVG